MTTKRGEEAAYVSLTCNTVIEDVQHHIEISRDYNADLPDGSEDNRLIWSRRSPDGRREYRYAGEVDSIVWNPDGTVSVGAVAKFSRRLPEGQYRWENCYLVVTAKEKPHGRGTAKAEVYDTKADVSTGKPVDFVDYLPGPNAGNPGWPLKLKRPA